VGARVKPTGSPKRQAGRVELSRFRRVRIRRADIGIRQFAPLDSIGVEFFAHNFSIRHAWSIHIAVNSQETVENLIRVNSWNSWQFFKFFIGDELHEFHENDRCDLGVIGLKYNLSQSLRPRCLDSHF
jgi:hypothetical protein